MKFTDRTLLWLTGRPHRRYIPAPWDSRSVLTPPPRMNWRMAFGEEPTLIIHCVTGPNVFHRWAQRLILGFRWRML